MWQDYELPTFAEIDGIRVEIRSDFRAILDIFAAYNDADLSEQEQIICGMQIFYTDFNLIKNYQEAANIMTLFINGNHIEKPSKEVKLLDWQQDMAVIIPPINRVLGQEIRQLQYLHWWTFLGAFFEIGECTFNTYVGIRDKKLKGKKLEKWESDLYRQNKDKIDIKSSISTAEQALIDEVMGL